jgi:hypothetical protein
LQVTAAHRVIRQFDNSSIRQFVNPVKEQMIQLLTLRIQLQKSGPISEAAFLKEAIGGKSGLAKKGAALAEGAA